MTENSANPYIQAADVKACVAATLGFKVEALEGDSRAKSLTRARHIAIYLTRKMTWQSCPQIARAFGNRDHTTILHACRKIEAAIDHDPDFAAFTEHLENSIVLWTKNKPTPDRSVMVSKEMSALIADEVSNTIMTRIAERLTDKAAAARCETPEANPLPVIKAASVAYLPVKVANTPVQAERDACIRDIIKAVTDWENARFSRYERAPLDALLAAAQRLKKASLRRTETPQEQRSAQHV
ncbi:MAG: hypothetical protein H2045_10610 [Rhizobiales bacterium]|nr:hypothetical protein [Hyphomicrobiales bacterium]